MKTNYTKLQISGSIFALFLCLVLEFLPNTAFCQYIIDNDRIRFGTGSEASINSTGNVQQPFYYNTTGGWRKLTFSSYPLDYSFAVGGDKTNEWNLNGNRVDNPTLTDQVIDASGFTLTSGYKGYGTIKSTGTFNVGSNTLRIETTYELLQTKSYVTVKTKVTNLSATTAENVRFWIGTRDDYVGGTDVPLKQKGNLTNGEFVEIPNQTTRSLALQIITGTEGVLFYTTSTKGNTIINSCCSWTNVINQDPNTSTTNVTSDGSYGFYVRMNDLAQNQSDEFTWYYAAGELADLEEIINDVAQASGAVSDITYTTANFKATTTVNSTGYYVVVPRDATAPTAAEIKAGVNYGSATVVNSGNAAMTANTEHSFPLSGLSVGTAYDLYFVSEDATPAFSEIAKVQFSTLAYTVPVVSTTDAATSITGISAVSGGDVNGDGGQSVSERGICWNSSGTPTISNSYAASGNGLGTFTANLSSLTPNTTYYVRAYATNSVGTGYGPQITFNTLPQTLASVTTDAIGSANENSASGGGNVSADGGASVSARGLCWNTSGNPTISDAYSSDGSGTGTFSSSLSGLNSSTTYYVRAYATNQVGTAYGNQVSFTTNHFLNYSAGAHGSLDGNLLQNIAHLGNGTAVTAIADENYHFAGWSDGSMANPRTDLGVTATVNVTANFAPHQLVFDPQPGTVVAGENLPVIVKVVDGNNQVVSTANNMITLTIGTNPTGGLLNGTINVAAVNGIAVFDNLSIANSGEGYTLNAHSDPLTGGTSTAFDILPAALAYFTVSGIADPNMAGTPVSPVITAYDVFGNIKTNYTGTVTFSTDDPIAEIPVNYTFTTGDHGIKELSGGVIFKTTGDHFLKVNDGVTEGMQEEITVTNAGFGYFTMTTGNAQNETAGVSFAINVTAYDIYDNLKTDYNGNKNLSWVHNATASGNGSIPVMAANGNRNFVNGQAVINGFKLFNAIETPQITVTDIVNSYSGSTPPINVLHNVLANFNVQTGTLQTAGIPFDVTVTARDQYYNTVTNYNGNISFKSNNDAIVSYPSGLQSMAGSNGVKTFEDVILINVVGTYWFRAADANIPIILGTQYNIVVSQNAFDGALSSLTVDYHTRIAGEYVTATITPRDALGNLLGSGLEVAAYLDGVASDYNGPIAVTDNGNGTYTAVIRTTSTTADNIISASVGGLNIVETQDIEVSPAAGYNNHLFIAVQPSENAVAGVEFAEQPVIHLLDGFNNIMSGDNSTLVNISAMGSGQFTGTLTIGAVNGVVAFNGLAYEIAEVINAEFTAAGYTSANSANINVSPAATAYYTLNSPADMVAGSGRAFYHVSRFDIFDNPVLAGNENVYLYHDSEGSNATFYGSPTGGSPISELVISDGSSSADFYFFDDMTGNINISASDASPIADGPAGVLDASDIITILPATLDRFEVSGIEDPHAFGSWQNVTVKALDIYGNIKTDYEGTITVQNTDAYAINPGDYTFGTNDNGVKTFEQGVLFSTPGLFWVTVLDLNEPAYYGYQANIAVTARPITIAAQNLIKEYGDTLILSGNEFEVNGGLYAGQEITEVEIICDGINRTAQTGDYTITISNATGNGGFDMNDYVISFATGTLSVIPAPLNVSMNESYTKVYGSSDPVFDFSISGFKLDDDISIVSGDISREAGEDAGWYDFGTGTLDAGNNYIMNMIPSSFEITKAPLSVTADNQDRVYGEDNGTLTYVINGFVNGDDIDDIIQPQISTAATINSPAGTYDIVVENADAENYSISYVNGVLTIGKAELEITVNDITRPYGTSNPAFEYEYEGFVNGDDESDIVLPAVSCLADSSSNVGEYDIELSGGSADNYELTLHNGTLTIEKADQTITFDSIPVVSLTAVSIDLSAEASSGEPVEFSSDNETVATIYGNSAHLLAFGTAHITASQEGSYNYNAAIPVERTLIVANLEGIAQSDASLFELYPNPSNGQFIVVSPGYSSRLNIYNMAGEVIYTAVVEKAVPTMINLGNIAGVYSVVFDTPQGIITKRLVIE